jgi:trehalose 6-phosphate phosphatase
MLLVLNPESGRSDTGDINRNLDRWCVFLDVDGTLLDIAPTPDAVYVNPRLCEQLVETFSRLQGALALVSGRPISAVDKLFAPHRWPVAGLHGLERRDASGRVHSAVTDAGALDAVRGQLAAAVAAAPGTLLEDKGLTIAVHFRAVPEREAELRRAVRAAAATLGEGYRVLEGKRVLELKPVVATKASAIRAYLAEPPFAGRRPLFVGDDVTDLDGFAAVEEVGGLSIAVGDRVDAQQRVASPRDVRALLADLAEGRAPDQ